MKGEKKDANDDGKQIAGKNKISMAPRTTRSVKRQTIAVILLRNDEALAA